MGFKVVKEGFSGYLGAILISSKIQLIRYVGTLNLLRWGQHPIDWGNIKSHGSPDIGERFGDNMVGFWWGLKVV